MNRRITRLCGQIGVVLLCALPAGLAMAASQVLVITGIGGEEMFDTRFSSWSQKVATASASVTGDPKRVVKLSGDGARREAVQAALKSAAETLRAGDQFVLVLLGHGTYDGSEYRFNLPGPDLTGSEMLALLDQIPTAVPQLVVNATSTSGAIAERWVRPHRVVITATKSGGERNAPKFGGFWADALTSTEADRDKDGSLTAQEAYDFANRKVTETFKSDAAIVTEHAHIGGTDPSRFVVARLGATAQFASDPQLIALRAEQGGIESQLAQLRPQKAQLTQDEYFDRIEPVLVELAKLGARIDARLTALGVNTGANADAAR
ncbi:MAG: hypothetical protein ABIQ86_10010 [Steroidobacteraceae bacterium]